MKILFVGDIVSGAGLRTLKAVLPELKKRLSPDFVVANGENASRGFGITPQNVKAIIASGVDVITGGNHSFDRREIVDLLEDSERVLRPANLSPGVPGKGFCLREAAGVKVGVINLVGRIFMAPSEHPFVAADKAIESLKSAGAQTIIVDFHAEATSEKAALAYYLDGRVSAVLGTHTHVPTADARILPGKTGFISDAGMTGDRESVIGIERNASIRRFLTGMPGASPSAEGRGTLMGVFLEVSEGKCVSIRRVEEIEP
ncbi:TIGR00282 family metallophosphoesterase [bacterium]|nr:MAG: TIGR00282 family metallophosphoesterase [bacterium]